MLMPRSRRCTLPDTNLPQPAVFYLILPVHRKYPNLACFTPVFVRQNILHSARNILHNDKTFLHSAITCLHSAYLCHRRIKMADNRISYSLDDTSFASIKTKIAGINAGMSFLVDLNQEEGLIFSNLIVGQTWMCRKGRFDCRFC
jgi:hypothetical protein